MNLSWQIAGEAEHKAGSRAPEDLPLTPGDAEQVLVELAAAYGENLNESLGSPHPVFPQLESSGVTDNQLSNLEAKYRALLEQLPAVIFMAYLDRGSGEAYVSPQIEHSLG
jgi:hypothetical protein